MSTTADGIIKSLLNSGVKFLFGMPGGGSNADLVEAAGKEGLPFVMAHTETAGAFMASAQAEITGSAGACIATLGPGASSIINGAANAFLDRVPLLLITDCHNEKVQVSMEHQTLDQAGLFKAVSKGSVRLKAEDAPDTVRKAAAFAVEPRPGPVHLDCSTEVTSAGMGEFNNLTSSKGINLERKINSDIEALNLSPSIERLIRQARRPLVLIGLGARQNTTAHAVRRFCQKFNLPALVTYKAKGVIHDSDHFFGGVLTNGALEQPVLEKSDLFIGIGLDPVELLAKKWDYVQPLISLSSYSIEQKHLPAAASLIGEISDQLEKLSSFLTDKNEWDFDWLQKQVSLQRALLRPSVEGNFILPHRVVELSSEAMPGIRITVDAGAHMFPVMAHWQASYANSVLISNGLATMGFALPAAVGAALLDRTRPVAAFTGDGGIMMCLSELKTAVREDLPVRVIVFDDEELSLIKVKQEQRGYKTTGVNLGFTNWLALGEAFGLAAFTASTEKQFEQALEKSANICSPVLIAAKINSLAYLPTIKALRG